MRPRRSEPALRGALGQLCMPHDACCMPAAPGSMRAAAGPWSLLSAPSTPACYGISLSMRMGTSFASGSLPSRPYFGEGRPA